MRKKKKKKKKKKFHFRVQKTHHCALDRAN
jgi:hypothetical protein